MLLRQLPVKEPERLVLFKTILPQGFRMGSYSGSRDSDPNKITSFPYQSYQRCATNRVWCRTFSLSARWD